MFFQFIREFAAVALLLFMIGSLLYHTRRAILHENPNATWSRTTAKVISAVRRERISFSRGHVFELTITYKVNTKEYVDTTRTSFYAYGEVPSSIEIVYKPESPTDWRFGEDYPTQMPPSSRVAIAWIWGMIFIVVVSIVIAVVVS